MFAKELVSLCRQCGHSGSILRHCNSLDHRHALGLQWRVMRGLSKVVGSVLRDAEAISHVHASLSDAAFSRSGFSSASSAAGQCIRAAEASLTHSVASPAASASASAALRTAGAASTSGRVSGAELLQLYKQLSKHRLSALVVSTAAAGFVAGLSHLLSLPKHATLQTLAHRIAAAG